MARGPQRASGGDHVVDDQDATGTTHGPGREDRTVIEALLPTASGLVAAPVAEQQTPAR